MLLSVVFDSQHQGLPPLPRKREVPPVEVVLSATVGAQHWDLCARSRESGSNHQQPQPRFLRRRRTGIEQVECRLELA
jgi:hypothetical protein